MAYSLYLLTLQYVRDKKMSAVLHGKYIQAFGSVNFPI